MGDSDPHYWEVWAQGQHDLGACLLHLSITLGCSHYNSSPKSQSTNMFCQPPNMPMGITHLWSKLCICASHTKHIHESNRYILSWTWARTPVLETEWKTMTIRMSTFKKGTGLQMMVITVEGLSWPLASPTLPAARGNEFPRPSWCTVVCHPFQSFSDECRKVEVRSESLVAMMEKGEI